MAIYEHDDLSSLIGNVNLTLRYRAFILGVLSICSNNVLARNPESITRNEINIYLNSNPTAASIIARIKISGFVPDSHFRWISDSEWQSEWIRRFIQKEVENLTMFGSGTLSIDSNPKIRSIALFDLWMCISGKSNHDLIALLDTLRIKWNMQQKLDRKFSWLESEIARQHFKNWLNHRTIKTVNKLESIDEALIWVNTLYSQEAEILLIAINARKIWSQQQRREKNADKKQCNFELSKSSIQKLERLAKKHRISRTELIEILINAEARDEYHITNILNKKHLLIESANY